MGILGVIAHFNRLDTGLVGNLDIQIVTLLLRRGPKEGLNEDSESTGPVAVYGSSSQTQEKAR